MKAKFSSLDIEKFELLKSSFEFIVPKADEVNVYELFKSYTVNIDFDHFERPEDDNIKVVVKIEVNNLKKPKPGYRFITEAVGIFSLKENDLDKTVYSNLKYYSTLNMMINNLRNVIFQTSNVGPMDGYLLPAIDVSDLFRKKKNREA